MSVDKLKAAIRDVPDFPKPGIIFKDITPILSDPVLFRTAIDVLVNRHKDAVPDKIAAIDARGFLLQERCVTGSMWDLYQFVNKASFRTRLMKRHMILSMALQR